MSNDASPAHSMHAAGVHANDPDLEVPMISLPLLAELAVLGALLDLAVNRVGLRAVRGVPHLTLVTAAQWGLVPRNLAAIAGFVALVVTLGALLRTRLYVPLTLRIGTAGLAGLFLPLFVLASHQPTVAFVIFASTSAHLLVVFFGLAAMRWSLPSPLRGALLALSSAALCSFAAMLVGMLAQPLQWNEGAELARTLRHVGEVGWLASAPLVALALPKRLPVLIGLVGGGFATMLATFAAQQWLGSDFPTLLYGAVRLDLFLADVPSLYAPLLGFVAGPAIGALLSPFKADRQLGIGLLLVLAAGYAPRAPGVLLTMVVGSALLWRGAVARATLRTVQRAIEPLHVPPSSADASTDRT